MRLWKGNKKIKRESNSRVNVIMAIIFIFAALIIGRLYQLQVLQFDRYTALAMRQQQVSSKLQPIRGRIFIQDDKDPNSKSGQLYPLATNKQFALVFANPNLVKEPEKTAESLYEIIDQVGVIKSVDQSIATDPTLASSSEEIKNLKRDSEIENKKTEITGNYLKILGKKDDPYEVLAKKVDENALNKIKELKLEGIDYSLETGRFYPEKNIGSHFLGFVGYAGDNQQGRYGLEGFFDNELSGKVGAVTANRSATGDLIVMNDKDYIKAEDGSDLILTINRSIEFSACEKLEAAILKHGADGGSVLIMEPKSGMIIAMCSAPDYDPNNYRDEKNISVFNNSAIFGQFEPGSTFKSITMAAALDQEKVNPNTTYTDKGSLMIEGWPKPIKNSDFSSFGGHGVTNMNGVLEKSLNTGAIFAMQQIGPQIFSQYVEKFGFGEKTGIELETESPGNINNLTEKKIKPISAATASFGQGITVTALQMITSYAAIANGGMLMKPYMVKEIVSPDGNRIETQPKQIRRVISERSATLLTGMLVNAVENGHAKRAQVKGYYVAGKTGTAQVASSDSKGYSEKTIQTFIGFAPVNDPKFVMLTRLDDPKDSRFAESSAVPLFGEIADFVLNYYQVPQERK